MSVGQQEPPHPPRSQRWGPWRLLPKSEPAKRLKILALHGFGGAPGELRPLGQALRSRGFLCQAPLLPGHGENLEGMAGIQLADWLEAVQLSYESLRVDDSPVVLLGFCLGGSLALRLASTLRPRAVCLLSTPVSPFPKTTFPLLGNLRSLERSLSDSASAEVQRWRSLGSHPLVPDSFFQQFQSLLGQLSRDLTPLDCPLLVAQSRFDKITSPSDAERIVRAVQSPRAKLVWSKKSGHCLPLDVGRRELFDEVVSFLETEDGNLASRFS